MTLAEVISSQETGPPEVRVFRRAISAGSGTESHEDEQIIAPRTIGWTCKEVRCEEGRGRNDGCGDMPKGRIFSSASAFAEARSLKGLKS